ncbi:MAG: hypothetical protein A3F93_02455 [Candidatus Magasanikbacteria bacterium RIFCSPLOWO2_12_FULL_34_7]|nr:MAG: hypothetical protein A3B83_03500 [Candidatus Magasanikbacteria bacterium RIFCSPHIGHO2_02_FULL_33_17]OGH82331.1 MAG: hypothetical protein A3F93_02455 [Candidatus Magasanikbacteria bacterium RIFCSPLOWO2_12_FULL_34_7]
MNNFYKKNKPLIFLMIILIFITIFGITYLQLTSNKEIFIENKKPTTNNPIINNEKIEDEVEKIKFENSEIIEDINNIVTTTDKTTFNETTTDKITIEYPIKFTLNIDNNTYVSSAQENTSLYHAMEKLSKNNLITFEAIDYSNIGYFITKLNGIENDNRAGKYWVYYINGESAKIGISNYIINNNDLIEWKYEKSNL